MVIFHQVIDSLIKKIRAVSNLHWLCTIVSVRPTQTYPEDRFSRNMTQIIFIEIDIVQKDTRLACGYGYAARKATRCLYKLNAFTHIVGCRSLEHLQNCGMSKLCLIAQPHILFLDIKFQITLI